VESNHYFPTFAESRITLIESWLSQKMPIFAFCKRILDGGTHGAGAGSLHGIVFPVFLKQIE
jgi:hypothetical protein